VYASWRIGQPPQGLILLTLKFYIFDIEMLDLKQC